MTFWSSGCAFLTNFIFSLALFLWKLLTAAKRYGF
ncbi:protein of unknown function [Magnetospirillum gryphiswaldense MSR-1 v2]|uniref:Uncharacterized protein n=1 Tax=Magnetospirillum gryphiswaldense (strain DSM 6361 / JCM 21280 / NBRC 15271 / MSR-1) TaxID=431944 RepID=V6F4K7_MAGGM|nr:protein of unknown function [Magnetospirillum gryphiswaldense MSR-1 v2]